MQKKQRDFLLVTGDDGLAQALREAVQHHCVTRRSHTMQDAAALLALGTCWSGLIVDLDGIDANPLIMMHQLRKTHPLLPVLTIGSNAELVNGLHAHRAELILKPFGSDNIVSFVQRALVSGWLSNERVAAWTEELARRRNLTSCEVLLLAYTLGTESRDKLVQRLGISEKAFDAQVRALLRKCEVRSIDGLAKVVLRDALVFPGPEPETDEGFLEQLTAAGARALIKLSPAEPCGM